MGRYRKIDSRIWNDQRVNALSLFGRHAFLWTLLHPSMTCLGAMRASSRSLAAELTDNLPIGHPLAPQKAHTFGHPHDQSLAQRHAHTKPEARQEFTIEQVTDKSSAKFSTGTDLIWDPNVLRVAIELGFGEVNAQGLLEVDDANCFIAAPGFFKYNPPTAINTVKAFATAAEQLPECEGKTRALVRAYAYLQPRGGSLLETFLDLFDIKALGKRLGKRLDKPLGKPLGKRIYGIRNTDNGKPSRADSCFSWDLYSARTLALAKQLLEIAPHKSRSAADRANDRSLLLKTAFLVLTQQAPQAWLDEAMAVVKRVNNPEKPLAVLTRALQRGCRKHGLVKFKQLMAQVTQIPEDVFRDQPERKESS